MQAGNNSLNVILMILGDLYSWGKSWLSKINKPGMYEVLEYHSILELKDEEGRQAKFSKVEIVRFMQNNIIAIQDQAWGYQKDVTNYQCSPGIPVDVYSSGHKTFVVISLREVKSKNDEEQFNLQWDLQGKPIGTHGLWDTYIENYTTIMTQKIIFPEKRPPIRLWVVEGKQKKHIELNKNKLTQLADRRWQVFWIKKNPRLYETYTIKWEW